MLPKKRDMKDRDGTAKGYRKNAKEIRYIAHDVRGDRERKALLAIAKQFDKLADALERQSQTEPA